tara:strand:- start:256 stop:696 length:441 start_codon:yes stop_codon:yes gene_type:complete
MPNKGKSRVNHLLLQLRASKDGTVSGTPVDRAAHVSYVDESVKNMIPNGRERADVLSMLARRRLSGESPKKQADAIEKMIESDFKKGGKTKSRVNEAGNYTKPAMRKRLFNAIKAGSKGGKPGQWSARKAQLLANRYKKAGGGYRN